MKTKTNPNQTFKNFNLLKTNQFAYSAAYACAHKTVSKFTPIYIYGDKNTGKTHLINAVLNTHHEKKILFTSGSTFSLDFNSSLDNESLETFRKLYCKTTEILAIDDIHDLVRDEAVEAELIRTIDDLHAQKKLIIIAGNVNPTLLPFVNEKLRTRVQNGICAEIKRPSLIEKVIRCALNIQKPQ